ncbi:MAG: M48 family metalloprotease [Candidatus Phaeomarinobacter sp.]
MNTGLMRYGFRQALAAALAFVLLPVVVVQAQISDSERRQGASAHEQIVAQYGGIYDDPSVGPYVARVTTRMAGASSLPNEEFRVTVLNSPVVNAFALPGGYVYVTRGLVALANSEAELASVIGHEIAHVTQRHGQGRQNRAIGATLLGAVLGVAVGSDLVNQIFSIGASGFLADYSRDQENEADFVGLEMLVRAGYDPYAAPSFLGSLGAQSALHAQLRGARYDADRVDWLASHPATGQRVRDTLKQANETGLPPGTRSTGTDAHFAAVDGMLYGDDPKEGYVRGQRFVHPDLRFAFEVPEGFQMTNSSAAVTARHSSGAQAKFDSASRNNASSMAEYLTKVWARDARLGQIESIDVNGIPTATGVTRVKGKDVRLVAYDAGDKSTVFRFLIATPPNQTAPLEPGVRDMVMSFTRLNAQQASEARPLRIDVHKVRRGESVASLAGRSDFGNAAEKRFRVLNGIEDGEQVQAGQMVKLVVE